MDVCKQKNNKYKNKGAATKSVGTAAKKTAKGQSLSDSLPLLQITIRAGSKILGKIDGSKKYESAAKSTVTGDVSENKLAAKSSETSDRSKKKKQAVKSSAFGDGSNKKQTGISSSGTRSSQMKKPPPPPAGDLLEDETTDKLSNSGGDSKKKQEKEIRYRE